MKDPRNRQLRNLSSAQFKTRISRRRKKIEDEWKDTVFIGPSIKFFFSGFLKGNQGSRLRLEGKKKGRAQAERERGK